MTFNSVFEVDDLVEYEPPVVVEAGFAFGFIRSVRFRKVDAVNFVAEYSIERCNTECVDEGVRETEIKGVFKKAEIKS